jgi:hypothetical protein
MARTRARAHGSGVSRSELPASQVIKVLFVTNVMAHSFTDFCLTAISL